LVVCPHAFHPHIDKFIGAAREKIQQGEMDKNKLLAWLDEALTRPTDRRLFDLPGGLLLAEVPTDV